MTVGEQAVGRPSELVARTAERFSAACAQAQEVVSRRFLVAGRVVMVRFAGQALVGPLTQALSHLATHDGDPKLTIDVWDSASTGAGDPPPLPGKPEGTPEGVRVLYDTHPIQAVYLPGERSLSVFDDTSARGWFWTADAAAIPHWERAAPLRYILNGWLGLQGHHVMHAGAVGEARGGVLLVGKGGSGKSTTCLTCVQAGFAYAGDDYSLISAEPPYAHPLYSSGKLHADHLTRFPALMPAVDNADRLHEEKAVLFVGDGVSKLLDAKSFPIRAVAVPHVSGLSHTTFERTSPAHALAALAPSTVFLMHGRSAAVMSAMARIVRQVPCYRLELGTALEEIPNAVRGLLDDAI